jgi:Mg2+ and Co2+ transporter CorA
MNFKLIPFATHPNGFILTVVFVVILSSFAFAYFKFKKWI